MTYNDLNAHPRDSQLEFIPESHTYLWRGREMKSVTTLIDGLFRPFDINEAALRVALRRGVDPQTVIDEWNANAEQARSLGTRMHDLIEHYYLGDDSGDSTDAMRLFRSFALTHRLTPYRTEWRIFHEDYDLAGTLDFLEITPSGSFIIWDWKRSCKLIEPDGRIIASSRYGSKGLPPIAHIPDTPYWHYALQVSVYRFILEDRYGLPVSGMKLGVFHPSYEVPWEIDLPYLHSEVTALLRSHIARVPALATTIY